MRERLVIEDTQARLVSRPLSVRIAAAGIGAILVGTLIAIASAALPSTIGGLVALAGVPLVIMALVRGARISLVADRNTIDVRNFLRSHRIQWEDVQAIGIGLHGMGGAPLDAVAITKRIGRPSHVTAQATIASSSERTRVLRVLKTIRPELEIRFPNPGR